jgi:AcrR family transcriptional regulator
MALAAGPDTRSRILAAALDLFSEHGFDGTTLQQIADRLGFTKAALYYHFPSKDDLLAALHQPAVQDLEVVIAAFEQMPDTPARPRRFVEAYLDFLLRHRRLIGYSFQDLATLAHPAVRSRSKGLQLRMEALLLGSERAFGEQIRVSMVFGGMHTVIAQHPNAEATALRLAMLDAVAALLRPGLRGPVRTRHQPDSAWTGRNRGGHHGSA